MTNQHPSPSGLPRRLWRNCTAATIALCLGAAPAALAQQGDTDLPTREITFTSVDGNEIGTGTLTGTPEGVLIEVDLKDLPEGWHGFHIHEQGVCDAEGGFKSAGGHFNPGDANHGLMVEGGAHAGDMPNQYAAADGTLKAQVLNPSVSMGAEEGDVSGRAIVIHSGPDDYESQPSGDAGERIACAVIR